MLRALVTLLVLSCSSQAFAADVVWEGQIKVWVADLCGPRTGPGPYAALLKPIVDAGCVSTPVPNGAAWKVQIPVTEETSPGYHVVSRTTYDQTVGSDKWSVVVLVTRMNTGDPKTSYLSVQTTLREAKFGLVAQCSRFDAIGAFSFLPPGACSGQMFGKLVGVSLYSPLATGAVE